LRRPAGSAIGAKEVRFSGTAAVSAVAKTRQGAARRHPARPNFSEIYADALKGLRVKTAAALEAT
jgi:hypothetical protein